MAILFSLNILLLSLLEMNLNYREERFSFCPMPFESYSIVYNVSRHVT